MKGFSIYLSTVFLVIVGCGGGGSGGGNNDSNESNPTDSNSKTAPQLITGQNIQVLEGQQTVVTLEATDKDGDILEFTLIEGADKDRFTLDSLGQLAFRVAPDFEAPTDANEDNLYEVNVSVSDGQFSNDTNLTIQVTNALEGRVVDGPLAEAQLFIDCDGNGIKNANETSATTDEDGYFMIPVPENCDNPIVISKGGRDITTDRETAMVLMAKLPDNFDLSENVVVTPVSTVLSYSDQEDQKTLLNNLGISSIDSSAQLLSVDPWQQTNSSTVSSKVTQSTVGVDTAEIQKVNAQLATLMETVDTLDGDGQNANVALAIADLASQEQRVFDLSNVSTLDEILDAAVDGQIPDAVVEAVATINTYLATAVDPTSDMAIEIISNSQQELQDNVVKLVEEEVTEEQFRQSNAEKITTIIQAPIATPSKAETFEGADITLILQGVDSDGRSAKFFTIQELPNHGSLTDSLGVVVKSENLPYRLPTSQISYSTESEASNDSFMFTVADTDSDSATQSAAAVVAIKITDVNDRPVALDRVATLKEGGSAQIELRGTDKDGDSLSYKIIELPEFGRLMDGEKQIKLTDLSYLLPQAGNSITYVSTTSTVASDSFYYVSNDGKVNSKRAKVTLNIQGANQIPVIEGQQALSMMEDESLEITLAHLTVSDSDNGYADDFTLELSSGINYLIEGNKIIPNANYVGDLRIPVTVNDGTHNSELFELTVPVTAVDDAPTLAAVENVEIDEDPDRPVEIMLQGMDIDSSELTYSVSGGSETTVIASVVDQTLTLKPAEHYYGSQEFTATVTADGKTASQVFTVIITAVNDAPTITSQPETTATENQPYSYSVTASDLDRDNVTLTATTPDWLNFDQSTNELMGTPRDAQVGKHNVEITAKDGQGGSTMQSFTIEVTDVNNAPVLLAIDNISFNEEGEKILTLKSFDIDREDELTFSITGGSAQTIQAKPQGSAVVGNLSAQQIFTLSSGEDYHGAVEFTATVTDDKQSSASQSFTVTVNPVNDEPRITSEAITSATEGQQYSYKATVDDPDDKNDGKGLTWSLSGNPVGMTVTKTGLVEWMPGDALGDSVKVTLSVADGGEDGAAAAKQTFTIQVTQVNDPGTVAIHGNTIVGQTLIAVVSDDDGISDGAISYKWKRGSSNSDITSSANSYLLTEADINETITVTATYTDMQGFDQELKITTPDAVEALPITKKTINIESAAAGRKVFDSNELNAFNTGNMSGYTLKELSAEKMMQIRDDMLSDNANRYPIYGYQYIQKMYPSLKDSSVFKIAENGEIILAKVPDLPDSYVGTGKVKTTIGKSHTLAVFDPDNKLAGLINIRFSPAEIDQNICSSSESSLEVEVTNNPVVLVHGWMGFDRAKMIDVDYWNKIASTLVETGAQVFTAKVDPWALSEMRGEQLIAYVECVLDKTDKNQVDLIGHSQGSPTARYAAYWLDNHDGHQVQGDEESKVSSVTSVQGTNYGGNVHIKDKAHLQRLKYKNRGLYQSNILVRDFDLSDLLFKFVNKGDLADSNTTVGKQYDLAIQLLDELVKPDGMLDATGQTLEHSKEIIDSLIKNDDSGKGILTTWLDNEEEITEFREKNWVKIGCNFMPGKCNELEDLAKDFYNDVIEPLNTSIDNMGNNPLLKDKNIDALKESIINIRNIKEELQKLQNGNEPDYHQLVINIEEVQNNLAFFNVANLTNLKDNLQKVGVALGKFKPIIGDYRKGPILNVLDKDELNTLEVMVSEFHKILVFGQNNVVDLLDQFIRIGIKQIIIDILSGEPSKITEAVNSLAALMNTTTQILNTIPGTIKSQGVNIQPLKPKIPFSGKINQRVKTDFEPLADALNNTGGGLEKIYNSLGRIKGVLIEAKGANDDSQESWGDLINWELDQINQIKTAMFNKFVTTDDDREAVSNCILENNALQGYLTTQFQNAIDGNDITLPDENDLSEYCVIFINSTINALVDYIVPLDEINSETGKQRSAKIEKGLYAVSSFGAQMFNLKYPDTGITPSRYGNCVQDHNFLNVNYQNANRSTKYYSIIGKRQRNPKNFSDRLLTNMLVTTNNTSKDDTLKNFTEVASGLMLINRSGQISTNGEMNPEQISNLFKNTDIVVTTCSQELGEVVLHNGSDTHDLNHAQGINQSLIPLFASDLIQLFSGAEVDDYASISNELVQCNNDGTVTGRKQCLLDLFPRIIIMYATGKAIKGLSDIDSNSTLDIFDLLKDIFKQDVDIKGVPNPTDDSDESYVPDLYRDHLQYVQGQN